MAEIKKDNAKWRVAIICIGLIVGIALLALGGEGAKSDVKTDSAEEYRAMLESELCGICSELAGTEVWVFVSLAGGYSYSYALDSRGGVLTVGNGSGESAVVEGSRSPAVAGVGIVYRGAQNTELESRLTELDSSSLGIGSNKIFAVSSKKSAVHS